MFFSNLSNIELQSQSSAFMFVPQWLVSFGI